MSFTQLEYIIAVDRHKHFGRAAEECHITQPTLSMQIQKLEEELGIVIFDRSKTPIIATDEGKNVIEQAKSALNEYKKIKSVAQESRKGFAGDFKLSVIPTLSPYIIPLFAGKFAKNYQEINLIIEENKTEDIINLLCNDEIDAALLVTPLENKLIEELPLYNEPFYMFICDKHEFFNKKEIHQDELDIKDIWLLNKGNCFRDQVLNICSKKKDKNSHEGNLKFESGSFETLKNMVLKNSGYTILPYMGIKELSNEAKKHVKPFKSPIPMREVSIVYSRKFAKKKIIKAIEKTIKSSLPPDLEAVRGKGYKLIGIY